MSEKPRKSFKQKQKKVFYKSVSNKKKKEKRNPENELTGIYKQGQWNFGFVDTVDEKTWEKQWYFCHESKKLDAFEGDEVAFELQYFRGKPEALIKKVIKRSEHLIVGSLQIAKGCAFVLSKNPLVKTDIFIPGKHIGGYTNGSQVAVQIIKWEWKNPEGRIVESLADLPTWREDIYRIAFEWWARKSFSESVKAEVKNLPKKIEESDVKQRKDLRNILTYTIDGAESKDLDDGISIEKIEEWYKLYVHIADVTHYVRENSALDREARKRGTSIYLCDQVIPMLPSELSNGLCSLHPGEDKLTLTCEIEIDTHWNMKNTSVYESIIHSDFRLTYREIDEIVKPHPNPLLKEREQASESQEWIQPLSPWGERIQEWGLIWDTLQFWWIITEKLLKNIQNLESLTDILSKYKYNKWVLNFEFPETKIILDDQGNPIEYKKSERYGSYKIIEECMVLANEAVSRQFAKYPFLYRVHELPDEEDIEKFAKIIESVDSSIVIPKTKWIKPKHFQQILEELKKSPKLQYFQKLLLRSLTKARYSEKNFGHFGLALDFYSHFTSPIRRYPDLQIHRIMKEIVTKKYNPERKEHYQNILPKVATRSSETAERAEKMEYKVRDFMACKYMDDKVGQEFTGKISGMIEKGFFVELPNTIEGFIEFWFSGLEFNAENFTILQTATAKELHFGSEVQVRLSHIDEQRMRLEFELV